MTTIVTMTTYQNSHTCLSLIDGMVTLLCRKVPTKRTEHRACIRRDSFTSLVRELVPELFDDSEHCSVLTLSRDRDELLCHLKFSRAVLEVLYDFSDRVPGFPRDSQLSLLRYTLKNWPRCDLVKNIKYFTVFPMARFLRNDPPPRPATYFPSGETVNEFLFSGSVLRFLKNRLNSYNRKNLGLFNSFLQGIKRGCHVVDDDFVDLSMKNHADILRVPPDKVLPLERVKDRLDALFSSLPPVLPLEKTLLEPACSASYLSARSAGGGKREISAHLCGISDQVFSVSPKLASLSAAQLLSMSWISTENRVESYYGLVPDLGLLNSMMGEVNSVTPSVIVHPVREPLKCRIITKADARLTFLCHPVQRLLWNHLFRFPCFSLLGRKVSPSLLSEVILDGSLPHEFFVSGDYSAATDGLNIDLTKLVLETFMDKAQLPLNLRQTCRNVLYEQRLVYPPRYKVPSEEKQSYPQPDSSVINQKNGQLMGSILSFPILCIINLLTFWLAYDEETGIDHRVEDLPVLINGDDILFSSTQGMYDRWLKNIDWAGFRLSIGKNYCHDRVAIVNSQCFYQSGGMFNPIGFLNTGLLTGQSKLSGRGDVQRLPCSDYYNEVVHTSMNPLRTHQRFLHYFRNEIDKITKSGTYNLFLPREAGGLGFIPPAGLEVVYTNFQRKFAEFLQTCMSRRVRKGKDPFRICLIQDNRPSLVFKTPPTRDRYVWVPQHLREWVDKLQDGARPLLSEPAVPDPPKPVISVRLPPKPLINSFRRCCRGLSGSKQLPAVFPVLVRTSTILQVHPYISDFSSDAGFPCSCVILPGWEKPVSDPPTLLWG